MDEANSVFIVTRDLANPPGEVAFAAAHVTSIRAQQRGTQIVMGRQTPNDVCYSAETVGEILPRIEACKRRIMAEMAAMMFDRETLREVVDVAVMQAMKAVKGEARAAAQAETARMIREMADEQQAADARPKKSKG